MAYLTEKEKSILFAAINREENVCKEHGYNDLVKVCQRLTFLFSYNRFEKDIRNKVIDEFEYKLFEASYDDYESDNLVVDYADVIEIAKKMKGE